MGTSVFTLTVMASSGLTPGSVISNTATVTSSTPDPKPGDESALATTTVKSPALVQGNKSVSGDTSPGSTVNYLVVLSNGGPSAQADNPGAEFTDVLPTDLTLVGAAASAGTATTNIGTNTVSWNGRIEDDSITITITATIKAGTDGHTVSNQGTINYDADGNGTNETTVQTNSADFVVGPTPPASVDLLLVKTGPSQVHADSDVTYTITVTNLSSSDASNATFSDTLPNGVPGGAAMTFVSFDQTSGPTWSCSTGPTTTCSIATLTANTTSTFNLVGHIPSGTADGVQFTNQTTVASDNDPNPENDHGATSLTVSNCFTDQTVTTNADSGAGSLRQAILEACDGSTIGFDGTLTGPITLTTGELVINKNLTINGLGANLLTVSGNNASRVFNIQAGKTATISGLTLTGGNPGAGDGGGVFNAGTLTLASCAVTGSSATSGGGLVNSTGGTMTVTASTISGNTAASQGGGIQNAGTLTLVNSTVSGNTGDGLSNGTGGIANLTNDTFAGNSIRGITSNSGATTNIRNTLVVNTPGAVGDLSGNFNSQGNNLIGKADGSTGFAIGDKLGTVASPLNALLAPLGNYDGPTQTHALLPGSPAIDAGNNCVTDLVHCSDANIPQLTTDQRGFTRFAGSSVDIGAFESRGFTIAATSGTPQSAVINTAFGAPLVTTVSSAFGEPVQGGAITFTAPGSGAGATFSGGVTTIVAVLNGSGQASTSATANGSAGGPYNVSATGAGISGAANFSLTNLKADQTISFAPVANQTFGAADFQVNPTATSGLAVNLAASGNCAVTTPSPGTVHLTGAGSCTITASQLGNVDYNPATSVPQSFTIAKASSSTAVSSSVNPSDFGQSVTFTATVTSGVGTPTGTVQFKDNGNNLGASIALNGSGAATFTTSSLTVGTHTITADYSGSTNIGSGTGTLAGGQVVKPQPSLSIDDPSTTEGQSGTKILNFTVTLSAQSNLTVTLNFATADNTATAGSDYVSTSGAVTFNPGETSKQIPVTINGDTSFEPGEALTMNLTNPVNATISKAVGVGLILNDDAQGGFVAFSSAGYSVNENQGFVTVTIVRTNDVSQPSTVDYATDDTGSSNNCAALLTGLASQRCDYTSMFGTLNFAANETQKTVDIPINLDSYAEGPETFTVKLSSPTGGAALVSPSTATVTINDSAAPAPNAIDDTTTFVRQQYRDFLNREADAAGLQFWKNNIDKCNDPAQRPPGQTLAACIEVQRITTSAAFFLSLEFRQTGGLVRDFYVATLPRPLTNNMPDFVEFMRDTQAIQKGVIVGQGNWQATLTANQQAFMNDFVIRSEFLGLYPTTDTPTIYVNKLYQHAAVPPANPGEQAAAIAEFGGAPTAADPGARARALLRVTQNATFQARELPRTFVQMEYFGYLRRNPNDPPDNNFNGFDFWLNKLIQFNGDYLQAEMVKAFLNSAEYRKRFGP
jgi:uncharacterized repeat protein (TIGR01451 family)